MKSSREEFTKKYETKVWQRTLSPSHPHHLIIAIMIRCLDSSFCSQRSVRRTTPTRGMRRRLRRGSLLCQLRWVIVKKCECHCHYCPNHYVWYQDCLHCRVNITFGTKRWSEWYVQVSRLEAENNELSRKLEKLTNSMDEQARLHNSQVWWSWWGRN